MRFKLANILFMTDELLEGHEGLLYRGRADVVGDGVLEFTGGLDLLTYFNALPVAKWKRYTSIDKAWLHVELAGDACVASVAHAYPTAEGQSPRIAMHDPEMLAAGDWRSLDLPIALDDAAIAGLRVASTGTMRIRNAYYYTEIDKGAVRPIRLALSTTTFNNEQYILPNIELVRQHIIASDEPIAGAFHMFVVDNGRTLDAEAISDDGVTVVPNPNVGGSGGFARGMIEALEWEGEPFTHVLLMDDDVRVFPESFVRTFNLLSLANDRYKDAFVSGAMLKLQEPNMMFEDISYIPRTAIHWRAKDDIDISTLEGAVFNESVEFDEGMRAYAGWWYCCIPLNTVRAKGLPLPLFIRFDDIEYSVRCNPRFMCMSGICVWHSQFLGRFRASTDVYQYERNLLIAAACGDGYIDRRFLPLRFWHNLTLSLRFLDYDQADFWLDALEDYLKGPDFIKETDGARLMKENSARNEKLVPLDQLDQEVLGEMEFEESWIGNEMADRNFFMKIIELLPYSKNMLPDALLKDKPVVIDYSGNATPRTKTSFRRTFVAVDITAENGHVRTMDKERYRRIVERYRRLRADFKARGEEIAEAWHAAAPELTSMEFWKQYLADRM